MDRVISLRFAYIGVTCDNNGLGTVMSEMAILAGGTATSSSARLKSQHTTHAHDRDKP